MVGEIRQATVYGSMGHERVISIRAGEEAASETGEDVHSLRQRYFKDRKRLWKDFEDVLRKFQKLAMAGMYIPE